MDVFTHLFFQLLPLYATIGLGYFAGKKLEAQTHTLGVLIIYIIFPIIMFDSVRILEITPDLFVVPLLIMAFCSLMCVLFLHIGRRIWPDAKANMMALMASGANSGYFGLPVAFMVFDQATYSLYVTAVMGFSLFESSGGFYISARGKYDVKESLIKALRVPALYAYVLGILVSFTHATIPEGFVNFMPNFKGMYIVAGMLMIGMSLSRIDRLPFNIPFISLAFVAKFLAWPLLVGGFILLDQQLLGWFDTRVYHILILVSIVPLPANSIVFAGVMGTFPEKVATTVLLSTVFALIYVPLMVAWLLS